MNTCCSCEPVKLVIGITCFEIVFGIGYIISRFAIGGSTDIGIFLIISICFVLAYVLELVGVIAKNHVLLCFNIIVRSVMVIALIVFFIVWFDNLNEQSRLIYNVP